MKKDVFDTPDCINIRKHSDTKAYESKFILLIQVSENNIWGIIHSFKSKVDGQCSYVN